MDEASDMRVDLPGTFKLVGVYETKNEELYGLLAKGRTEGMVRDCSATNQDFK